MANKDDSSGQEGKTSSFDDIESRLEGLGKKLDKIKKEDSDSADATRSIAESHSAMGKAFQVTSELVGPVLVSTFIGYWLDKYFDTKPLLIITFFVLGMITGFFNVIRAAHKMQAETIASGAYKDAKDITDDDDDE